MKSRWKLKEYTKSEGFKCLMSCRYLKTFTVAAPSTEHVTNPISNQLAPSFPSMGRIESSYPSPLLAETKQGHTPPPQCNPAMKTQQSTAKPIETRKTSQSNAAQRLFRLKTSTKALSPHLPPPGRLPQPRPLILKTTTDCVLDISSQTQQTPYIYTASTTTRS